MTKLVLKPVRWVQTFEVPGAMATWGTNYRFIHATRHEFKNGGFNQSWSLCGGMGWLKSGELLPDADPSLPRCEKCLSVADLSDPVSVLKTLGKANDSDMEHLFGTQRRSAAQRFRRTGAGFYTKGTICMAGMTYGFWTSADKKEIS